MLLPMNPYAFDAISRTGGVKRKSLRVDKTGAAEGLKSGGDDVTTLPDDYEPAYKIRNRRQKRLERRRKSRRGYRENRLHDTRSGLERRKLNRRAGTVQKKCFKRGLDVKA
ncbi:MAG: hypothetical protein HOM11_17215 [Methylococcales bacterium]|jgi:hypothetical protein|nr:hypothetical protein [Methylococcales bacterium]MBT7445509.1 hypothetical protein [Methylococcales bacterium]